MLTSLILVSLCVLNSEQIGMKAASTKKLTYSSPDGQNKMFIMHSSESDLDSSASGYIYQSNGHGPATIVQLGEHEYQHPPVLAKLLSPIQFDEFSKEASGFGDGSSFGQSSNGGQSSKGSENNQGFYNSEGNKGEKGYKGFNSFNKGLSGKHNKQKDAGFYNQQGGGKTAHNQDKGTYGSHYNVAKGNKGGSYGQSSSFKKGEKTSGYHNIFHKDEYKKEHSFYDESDKSGHHKSQGDSLQKHGAEKGTYNKGGYHDSGYNLGNFGKKGFFDKGNFNDEESGHKGAEGEESYFGNDEEYGSKGSTDYEKEFGGEY